MKSKPESSGDTKEVARLSQVKLTDASNSSFGSAAYAPSLNKPSRTCAPTNDLVILVVSLDKTCHVDMS